MPRPYSQDLRDHVVGAAASGSSARAARLLFLPPYSPDLDPIELAFAKLKALLRKAGECSVDELWTRIGALLDDLTPEEYRSYFKHAGYA